MRHVLHELKKLRDVKSVSWHGGIVTVPIVAVDVFVLRPRLAREGGNGFRDGKGREQDCCYDENEWEIEVS
jgi:hypothetical protein